MKMKLIKFQRPNTRELVAFTLGSLLTIFLLRYDTDAKFYEPINTLQLLNAIHKQQIANQIKKFSVQTFTDVQNALFKVVEESIKSLTKITKEFSFTDSRAGISLALHKLVNGYHKFQCTLDIPV